MRTRATLRNLDKALDALASLQAKAIVYGPKEYAHRSVTECETITSVLLAVRSGRTMQSISGQVRHTERYFTREG